MKDDLNIVSTIKEEFTTNHLMIVNLISEIYRQMIMNMLFQIKCKYYDQKVSDTLVICDNILNQKTHKDAISSIMKGLPVLLEFKSCCVFLYDPISKRNYF